MYLQIMEQINLLVANGSLLPGSKMPSIRELAVATQVSVITVKRAYQELERSGVLITQAGIGSFVTENDGLGDQIMQQEIDKHLKKALQQAKSYGLSVAELTSRLERLGNQPSGDDDE